MNAWFDVNFWRSATTVVSLVVFLGILLWAYAPKHKAEFEEAALLPFQNDKEPS
ncbi:MAG: cbb3-type cytochrome c oxidase subunit 3 [Cytophagales bacterium]|nr:cbb3-type cytochrome c oxidase subunit 3 [Cytophagales bacterium]